MSQLKASLPEDEGAHIEVPQPPDEAQSEPWHELYWRAWSCVRYDRYYGALGGESPISYMAISRFAADNGIAGADFTFFHRLLSALDDEWLMFVAQTKGKGES
ncbi:hypothetical protein IB024_00290 [Brucella sp. 6810]|uniref:hypothetical protein n=1 Tax=Brucella sp. 6810 TaxID=2769351 RepID=UPI00165B0941|nr:hypothetical protein [Brucella sp. 6810]QNQ62239.1 hypothetical protein IB024_00290 [Brucella sp. 6810]